MSDYYPEQLKQAAAIFPYSVSAFAQFRQDGRLIRTRLQAPEVMVEFAGEVQFGRDPRGLLFYHEPSDFKIGEAQYRVSYLKAGKIWTVVVNFFVPDETNPFARFLARVDTTKYQLPPESSLLGEGKWRPFIAATTQTSILRVSSSKMVRLRCRPIEKQVRFTSQKAGSIDANGVLIFPNLRDLLSKIPPTFANCVVDYAPDRFVFYPQGKPEKVVALFLPDWPVDIGQGGVQAPAATWSDYKPDENNFSLDLHEFEEEEE